jgi:hypothetical protein
MEPNKINKEIQLKKQLIGMEKDPAKKNKLNTDVKKLQVKMQLSQLKKK